MNPLFLVVGPPAVGKSTTSRALAARFSQSIHIPVDDIRNMVVSGLMLPSAVWSDDLARQIALARTSVVQMALTYSGAGFAVVIDDFWDSNHQLDYALLLGHPLVHRIVLYPAQAEAHRRNLERNGDHPARAYLDEGIQIVYPQMTAALPQLSQAGWMVIDTTNQDVEAAVTAILRLTAVPTDLPIL